MSWNKRIKDLRIDHDMGKKELADKLDISERTLTRYESGISEPTISVLIKLSLLFNVSIDYMPELKTKKQSSLLVLKKNQRLSINALTKSLKLFKFKKAY